MSLQYISPHGDVNRTYSENQARASGGQNAYEWGAANIEDDEESNGEVGGNNSGT